MGPNIAELDALLAWAEAEHAKALAGEPSEWNQHTWATSAPFLVNGRQVSPPPSCGTACCLAGKAVARAGGRFLIDIGATSTTRARMPEGNVVWIEDKAQEILGLTLYQAEELFAGGNTIYDVRSVIAQLKDGVEYPERTKHDDEWTVDDLDD